jgi:hypothetical protein
MLSDSIAAGAPILPLQRSLLLQTLLGELPTACLDTATKSGSRLLGMSTVAQVELKWHFLIACARLRLSVEETLALGWVSKTIEALLATEPKITAEFASHAFALMRWDDDALIQHGIIPAHLAVTRGDLRYGKPPFPIAWSADGAVLATHRGVLFQGRLFQSQAAISVRSIKEFVQTGWTHQRQDGQPDRRHKHNPPVGHWEIRGYTLKIDDHEFHYVDSPERIATTLLAFFAFYFDQLRPLSRELERVPNSGWVGKLLQQPPLRCPHCGEVAILEPGKISEPTPRG